MPECGRCEHDESVAREFGCGEEPAPKALYRIQCGSCGGVGCERCERQGTVPMYRCPKRLARGRADLVALVRAYLVFDEHGVLPASGGMMDQAAGLVAGFEVLRSEKIAIDREQRKKDAAEAERREKIAEHKAGRSGMRIPMGMG
jgi:hypothetical protein